MGKWQWDANITESWRGKFQDYISLVYSPPTPDWSRWIPISIHTMIFNGSTTCNPATTPSSMTQFRTIPLPTQSQHINHNNSCFIASVNSKLGGYIHNSVLGSNHTVISPPFFTQAWVMIANRPLKHQNRSQCYPCPIYSLVLMLVLVGGSIGDDIGSVSGTQLAWW